MDMRVRRTRTGRVLALWAVMFVLTVLLVGSPTGFSWPFWTYGLVWGVLTSALHYAFRKYFEEDVEIRRGKGTF